MDAGSIPAASTIFRAASSAGGACTILRAWNGPPTSSPPRPALAPGAGRGARASSIRCRSASSSRSSSRPPASSSCSRAAPCRRATGDDGAALIALTVASALSLALLWWSPLASLVAALALLCAQSIAGYEFTQAAVWAVVVASFATVAFDHWKRAVAAGFVVDRRRRHRVRRRLPGVTWESRAEHLGLALGRVGRGGRHPRLPRQHRAGRAPGRALRGRPRGARPRGGRRGARAPRARAARQRRARPQRRRAARGRRAARHREEAGAGARGAGLASRRRAARRSATSSACSASCARPTRRWAATSRPA